MSLTYLKLQPEQAVVSLNEMIVSGYQLKDKLIAEYKNLPNSTGPRSLDSVVPPDTRAAWTQQILDWTNNVIQRLLGVYLSQAEAYKFKEAQPLPLSSSEFDGRFYGQLIMLQARIDILNSYKDFIFQHSNIQIVAGRDANVQVGGSQNTQEVNNEGQ